MAKFTKEQLMKELETKTVKEIALEYGIKEASVYKTACNYHISIKKIPSYQQKEYLMNIDLSKTNIYQLGKEFSVDPDTIKRWFKKYQLPWKWEPWRDKKWIEEKLKECEGSVSLIARKYGFNFYTINQQCIKFGYRSADRKSKFSKKQSKYFNKIDNEYKAYFLGFLMADGNMNRNLKICSLCISEKDKEILVKLKEELQLESNICVIPQTDRRQSVATLCISSADICKDLIYHGIVPKKTGRECLPDTIPEHLIRHFIRGFIDGDGYISSTKTATLVICSKSRNILYSIQDYFTKSLSNFTGGSIATEIDHRTRHELYLFRTYAQNTISICQHIYQNANIYLSRKYEAYTISKSLRKESKKKSKLIAGNS